VNRGYQSILGLKPGDEYRERGRSASVEGVGEMRALVYYCKGKSGIVRDRPTFWTANDVLARVECIHRCGTDVKTVKNGRADQIDESIISDLRDIAGVSGDYDPRNAPAYFQLLESGARNASIEDELYGELAETMSSLSDSEREELRNRVLKEGGRILGHEMTVTVVKVGSNVRNLTEPLGYTEHSDRLPAEYLDFQPGERLTVQTRVAKYEPPSEHLRERGDVRGVQLLGENHENMAMTLDGGFSQYLRLTPEMIRSGSLIRLPEGINDVEAALVEPTACLLDCLNLTTHPEGQGNHGNIFKTGVKRGGVTAVIGSGAMGYIAAALALSRDEKVPVGHAAKVVMLVRSDYKADLGKKLFRDGEPLEFVIDAPGTPAEKIVRHVRSIYGADFGFDDIVLAGGGPETLALAHILGRDTGTRIQAFAGTRGPITVESGFWHYGNAATSGTSGCNTKAMENVIGLIERGLKLQRFSGNRYTLADLEEEPMKFFDDTYLRPLLLPNEGVEEAEWEEQPRVS